MAQANATKHHQGEHNRLREKTEGWKNEDELSDLPPSQPLLDSVLNAEQVQTSNQWICVAGGCNLTCTVPSVYSCKIVETLGELTSKE